MEAIHGRGTVIGREGYKAYNISIVSKAWSYHELAHLMYDIWDIRASVMERGDPSYQRACSTKWNHV